MLKKDFYKVTEIITLAGAIVLSNGGETYRAENICTKIAHDLGIKHIDVMALPTGLFISMSQDTENFRTTIRRVKNRNVNLEKLALVFQISNEVQNTPIDKTLALLKSLNKLDVKRKIFFPFFTGISSGVFCMMVGGHFGEFAVAFTSVFIFQMIALNFKKGDVYNCLVSLFGGFCAASFSLIASALLPNINYGYTIIGSMIPLLPGLSFTNSIRDTMNGDLLSGTARMAEALMVAASLAFGVALALGLKGVLGIL